MDHNTQRPSGHVHVRRATPDDADAVRSMVLRCSAESLYARFLTVVPPETAASNIAANLSSPTATWWLAEVGGMVIGIGAIHMFDDDGAEFSLLVEDAWQQRGIGTCLLPHLVDEARARAAAYLWATALGERMPIIRKLVRGAVGKISVSLSSGIAEMTAELPASAHADVAACCIATYAKTKLAPMLAPAPG